MARGGEIHKDYVLNGTVPVLCHTALELGEGNVFAARVKTG